ncbi:hypothetical protein Tco_0872689 [Tanacetum coccineum]
MEQLDRSLVGKIQIVDVGKLWEYIPIVGRMTVLQTVKTDMVKHDVEVESSGECVDEIDKLTEIIVLVLLMTFLALAV